MSRTEKDLLIKRTESSVEITVGGGETPPTTPEPQEPQPSKHKTTELSQLERCCLTPLSRVQLCIVAMIAILTLILALFVIVILAVVLSSHSQRIAHLEVSVALLEAQIHEGKFEAAVIANLTIFEAGVMASIDLAINNYQLNNIEELSLMAMAQELGFRVRQLENKTEKLEKRYEQLANQTSNTPEVQSEGEVDDGVVTMAIPDCSTFNVCFVATGKCFTISDEDYYKFETLRTYIDAVTVSYGCDKTV